VDLLGGLGDEDEVGPTTPEKTLPPATASGVVTGGVNVMDSLDDFGDFEGAPAPAAAPVSPTVVNMQAPIHAQAPATGGGKNLFDLLGQKGAAPAAAGGVGHARQLSGGAMGGMGMGGGMMSPSAFVNAPQRTTSYTSTPSTMGSGLLSPSLQPTSTPTSAGAGVAASKPTGTSTGAKSTGGGFEDLWSMSLSSAGGSTQKKAASGTGGKSMLEIEREKAQKGLWGAPTVTSNSGTGVKSAAPPSNGGFGNFSSGGDDDLLL